MTTTSSIPNALDRPTASEDDNEDGGNSEGDAAAKVKETANTESSDGEDCGNGESSSEGEDGSNSEGKDEDQRRE